MHREAWKEVKTSDKQNKSFCEATHRFNIWVGAVRSGKTFASIERFIYDLKNGPPGDAMIIGINRGSIQRNILKHLYNRLGFPCPTEKSQHTMLYGRNVWFVGAPDVGAVATIQGSTLALAYVDEATNLPEPFWRMLESRLSVPGAKILATCNPEGPAHWLKKDFIDKPDLDLVYWNFSLEDNPILDENFKKQLKASYNGMWYNRYILGEWALAYGAIYDCYDKDNEYTNPFPAPNYYIVGVDYGTTNATAAVLCAVSPKKWPQIRVESEYYYDSAKKGRAKTDQELVRDIKEFIGHKNVSAIYVDPAAASLKIALRQADLPVLDANNDVLLGIKTCSKFISGKNIVIHKSCTTLREHLQSYAWDPKAADRGEDKPIKKNDHICLSGESTIITPYGVYCINRFHGKIYERANCEVKSWDGTAFKFKIGSEVVKTGIKKKIIKITLKNGKTLKATPDHQVLTKRGYVEIQFLLLTDEVLCYD
jgi:PBSX family phage terminase large subunit